MWRDEAKGWKGRGGEGNWAESCVYPSFDRFEITGIGLRAMSLNCITGGALIYMLLLQSKKHVTLLTFLHRSCRSVM